MLIAAACVGILCAYHFGTRAGLIGAGVALALFVAALVMPAHALAIYIAVGAGVVGICMIGPRVSRDEARPVKRALRTGFKLVRRIVEQARRAARQ